MRALERLMYLAVILITLVETIGCFVNLFVGEAPPCRLQHWLHCRLGLARFNGSAGGFLLGEARGGGGGEGEETLEASIPHQIQLFHSPDVIEFCKLLNL